MSLSPKQNKLSVARVSFLWDEAKVFLTQGTDLMLDYTGTPLDEMICNDLSESDGFILNPYSIPYLVDTISRRFKWVRNPNISIKNSRVVLFVYTFSKLDDIVLFHVWQITTTISHETRETWEEKFNLTKGACCRENYSSMLKQRNILGDDKSKNIELDNDILVNKKLWMEKNCKYKTPYIKCTPYVLSYFFNRKNKDAVKCFQEAWFNIPITREPIVGGFPEEAIFCYGGFEKQKNLKCTCLYDSIVFEKTSDHEIEHNFKDFLSDSLATCYNYQVQIWNRNPRISIENTEQRLLYVSMYL